MGPRTGVGSNAAGEPAGASKTGQPSARSLSRPDGRADGTGGTGGTGGAGGQASGPATIRARMSTEDSGWLYRRLGRNWRTLLIGGAAGLVAGAIVGGIIASTATMTYTSTSRMLITPQAGNPYVSDSAQNAENRDAALRTEAELVTSTPVADGVHKRLGPTTEPGDLAARTTVRSGEPAAVLTIEHTASTPSAAAAGARAFADTYLAYRAQRTSGELAARLKAAYAEQTPQLVGYRSAAIALSRTKSPATRKVRMAELQAALGKVRKTQATISALKKPTVDPGQLVSAGGPAVAKGVGPAPFWLGGMALGLLVGLAFATRRATRVGQINEPSDVRRAGLTVLGPMVGGIDRPSTILRPGSGLRSVWRNAMAPIGDTDRSRRAMVISSAPDAPTTLLISGVGRGAGPDALTSAVWLAVSLARADRRVLVIDTTRGIITNGLAEPVGPGLSDVLLHGADPGELIGEPQPGLGFLSTGGQPDESAERFASPRFAEVLAEAKRRYDYVVLATSDIFGPDSLALIRQTDAVILGATTRLTRRDELLAARDEIEVCGGLLQGVLMTAYDRRTAGKPNGSRTRRPAYNPGNEPVVIDARVPAQPGPALGGPIAEGTPARQPTPPAKDRLVEDPTPLRVGRF